MTEIDGFEIHFLPACNDACGGLGDKANVVSLSHRGSAAAGKALHMNRLCLVGLGLLCSVATTKAESAKPARAHPVKASAVKVVAPNRGGLAGVNFSNPYAPPVGTQKAPIARFPTVPTETTPVDLSISAEI